jgi:hypothetical protein
MGALPPGINCPPPCPRLQTKFPRLEKANRAFNTALDYSRVERLAHAEVRCTIVKYQGISALLQSVGVYNNLRNNASVFKQRKIYRRVLLKIQVLGTLSLFQIIDRFSISEFITFAIHLLPLSFNT